MLTAIHQPNYLPNFNFFYKMARAEQFVIITNIEFERRDGWQRRNRIREVNGDRWLTVPVKGSDYQMIKDVTIDNTHKWQHRHKKTIETAYAKTKEKEVLEAVLNVYDKKWKRLADINIAFIQLLRDILEIPTPLIIDEETTGAKHELHINICRKYGADVYLSGRGAKAYMSNEYFAQMAKNGTAVRFVDTAPATSSYSIVHHIFTEGKDTVRKQFCL